MLRAWLFQNLPQLIVRDIIAYTAGPNPLNQTYVDEQSTWHKLFCPLLGTCQLWRNATLSLMYYSCYISTKSKAAVYYKTEVGNKTIQLSLPDYMIFARVLNISFSYEDIANGSALSCLNNIPTNDYFAKVHTVDIELIFENEKESFSSVVPQSVFYFFQRLAEKIPPTAKVKAKLHEKSYFGFATCKGYIDKPLQQFFSMLPVAGKYDMFEFSLVGKHLAMQNMTNISCYWDEDFKNIAAILHANSKTLVSLSVMFKHGEGIEHILFDSANNAVTYPDLNKLAFTQLNNIVVNQLPNFPNIAPFPALKYLCMKMPYPFSDDVVFRDNGKTLENLHMQASAAIIRMFFNCGVFSRQGLANLKDLGLDDEINEIDAAPIVANIYLKAISNVLPSLNSLLIMDSDIAQEIPKYILKSTNIMNINFLKLPTAYIPLSTMLQLMKQLPTLQTLCSTIVGLGKGLSLKNAQTLAQYICEKYTMPKSQFQKWIIMNNDFVPRNVIIFSTLMLSELCSQFNSTALFYSTEEEAESLLGTLITSKLYATYKDKYTPQLTNNGKYSSLVLKRNLTIS